MGTWNVFASIQTLGETAIVKAYLRSPIVVPILLRPGEGFSCATRFGGFLLAQAMEIKSEKERLLDVEEGTCGYGSESSFQSNSRY